MNVFACMAQLFCGRVYEKKRVDCNKYLSWLAHFYCCREVWIHHTSIIRACCSSNFLTKIFYRQTHSGRYTCPHHTQPHMASPVDVVKLVNRVDGQYHLSQIEFGHLLWQSILKLTEQSQKVTTHIVVHDQVLEKKKKAQRTLILGE